ncbi:PLP-dependent aminotransferase family protein [Kitasatospora sp. CB02891]|uniref:MocR-like pyridoxine biosynthesis transcription factor PdxR n=1 Tax=Kitasatospora sp. CB02891 TaxID=2020329 RepID=UPI0018E2866D|nr:PLP-dependent aminotransferase family protein [Kitasatospora sp. CB02891]
MEPPRMEAGGPQFDFLLQEPLSRARGGDSLQKQLLHRIRAAVLDGRLPAGSRLPGSRALAESVGVSRNTVTLVYEVLSTEGYIEPSRQGTRVAALVRPEPADRTHPTPAVPARRTGRIRRSGPGGEASLAFAPGLPALAQFPLAAWRRSLDGVFRQGGTELLGYGPPQGEPALRTAVLRHLALARGMRCTPEQIVITEGAQEALALCVRLVTDPGDTAWVEDPGYRGAQTALACGDLTVVPVPVDQEGLRTSASDWADRPPRLVCTTPAHQYPTGAVLTASRRLDLIEKCRRHGAWIVEDDYDSEFRHSGEPLACMQGMTPGAPVFYVGTFSKTLFPSLRIGFLVLPEPLVDRAGPVVGELLRGGHRHEQLALAHFMESGQYSRHLARMRRLYRRRRDALRAALAEHFDVPHTVTGGDSGMHLTVRLPPNVPDQRLAAAARRHRIAPRSLSQHSLVPDSGHNGLVLGYGNTPESAFAPNLRRLADLVRELD